MTALHQQKLFFYLLLFISIGLHAQVFKDKELLLKVTDYNIHFHIDYENEKLHAKAILQIKNTSNKEVTSIPLLLYRLLKVNSIKDNSQNSLQFSQQVLSFEDWETYQVNFIHLQLKQPIPSGKTKSITIDYSGYLLGYEETGMKYVKDHIHPEFTILRPDCNAYPTLGYPSFEVNDAAGFENFTYKIHVTVPDSLVVANGGRLINIGKKNKKHTYSYESIKPSSRIDVAIANYKKIENDRLHVFHFQKDSIEADIVLKEAKKAISLYSKWWGKLKKSKDFSIIEIPNGWGSQADVTSIIQSAEAFSKREKTKLYHEISHLWNVQSNDTYPPRINEGLAMFIQYLTLEKLYTKKDILEKKSKIYLNRIKKSKKYGQVPIIDYGKELVTQRSYISGMLFFHVLYKIIGENNFHRALKLIYDKYSNMGAKTDDLLKMFVSTSRIKLDTFFSDWIYTTNYVTLIKEGYSLDDFVKKYHK